MTKIEPGQLWEWANGAFTGTRFLVMRLIPHPSRPDGQEWALVEIQEFIGGGIKPRQISMTALRGGARHL